MRRGSEGGSGGPGALRQRSDRHSITPIHLSRGSREVQTRAIDRLRACGWELLACNTEHATLGHPARRHEFVFVDVVGRMRRGRTLLNARSVSMRDIG